MKSTICLFSITLSGLLATFVQADIYMPQVDTTISSEPNGVRYTYTLTNNPADPSQVRQINGIGIDIGIPMLSLIDHSESPGWLFVLDRPGKFVGWTTSVPLGLNGTAFFSILAPLETVTNYSYRTDGSNWGWYFPNGSAPGNSNLPVPAPVPEPALFAAMPALCMGLWRRKLPHR